MRFLQRMEENEAAVAALTDAGYSKILSHLLAQRGITSSEQAQIFLHPDIHRLHDPMRMQDMDKAVCRIETALQTGERIVIYGDYDADGVTATSVLKGYFAGRGVDVDYYIPSRHEEGYGLNACAVTRLAKDHSLLITVDCGITSREEVALAGSLGMDVIITDHHQLPAELPQALAVINPLLGSYPCPFLCGAGVALKLVQALGGIQAADAFCDLAAIGTVADIVPLTDENRIIAAAGIARMNQNMRPGLQALCEVSGLEGKQIDSGQIGFVLGPRINAGGRLARSSKSVEMMLASDKTLARSIAIELNEHNAERQRLECSIFKQCLQRIESEIDFVNERAIVLMGEDWNIGVVGIVASRMTERYSMPCILLAHDGDKLTGSGRSVRGVHLLKAIGACSHLLTRFGGHEMAAGISLPEENLPAFRSALNEYLRKNTDEVCYEPKDYYDLKLTLNDISMELSDEIQALLPCGLGNPVPTFLIENVRAERVRKIGAEQKHIKCQLIGGRVLTECVGFSMAHRIGVFDGPADILAQINKNEWNGRVYIQALLRQLVPAASSFSQRIDTQYDEIMRDFFCNIMYNVDEASLPQANVEFVDELPVPERGDLFICTDALNCAQYGSLPLARFIHAPEPDKRAFACLVTAPIPDESYTCYRRFIFLDDADRLLVRQLAQVCPHAQILARKGMPPHRPLLPNRKGMRSIYAYLQRRTNTLNLCANAKAAAVKASEEIGVPRISIYTAMMVFAELGFLRLRFEPWSLRLACKPEKRDLLQSRLYRRIGDFSDLDA